MLCELFCLLWDGRSHQNAICGVRRKMAGLPLLLVLLVATGIMSVGSEVMCSGKLMPSILEYFPELKGDLTKVGWAHAVNSVLLLKKALSDGTVMMLEADVVLGKLLGKGEIIPIMAHPPNVVSDLSLEMFIKAAVEAQKDKRKGLKLDFKSIEAFQASSGIIDLFLSQLSFPVLLNADILPGPVDSKVKPVDAEVFLNVSARRYPGSTLSLGWTTRFGPGMEGVYTEDQLRSMLAAIQKNNVRQPVTLCLRAGIVAGSHGIKELVDQIDAYQKSKRTTVTIWMSSDSDPVDIPKLKNLIFVLKRSRVLLDVPEFIRDKLELEGDPTTTPISAAQEALVALLTSVSAVFTNMF